MVNYRFFSVTTNHSPSLRPALFETFGPTESGHPRKLCHARDLGGIASENGEKSSRNEITSRVAARKERAGRESFSTRLSIIIRLDGSKKPRALSADLQAATSPCRKLVQSRTPAGGPRRAFGSRHSLPPRHFDKARLCRSSSQSYRGSRSLEGPLRGSRRLPESHSAAAGQRRSSGIISERSSIHRAG